GLRLPIFEIIHRVARRAAEFIDVAEAFSSDNSDPRAGTSQQCIEAERGAVYEVVDVTRPGLGFLEALQHPSSGIPWRGLDLLQSQGVGFLVQDDHVGERPTNVNRDTHGVSRSSKVSRLIDIETRQPIEVAVGGREFCEPTVSHEDAIAILEI